MASSPRSPLFAVLLSLLLVLLAAPSVRSQNFQLYFCWLSFSDPQTSGGAVWTESISGNLTVSAAALTLATFPTLYTAPVVSLSGVRTYSTPSGNWTSAVSLGSSGTDGSSNSMYLFIQNASYAAADSRQLDSSGITLSLATASPLTGTTNMVNTITIKWSSTTMTYVQVSGGCDESAESLHVVEPAAVLRHWLGVQLHYSGLPRLQQLRRRSSSASAPTATAATTRMETGTCSTTAS